MELTQPKPAPWTFREDLELFGIKLPEKFEWDQWAAKFADSPARNTGLLVLVSSILFLKAEKGHNPKVNDIYDAMVYCSTCLSVGYGDIFAKTPAGKLIGTILMTMGPAAANKFMEGPPAPPATDPTQREILSTLQKILEQLQTGDHEQRRD
jgi:hypothetical protein